jgi:hypothetical protein
MRRSRTRSWIPEFRLSRLAPCEARDPGYPGIICLLSITTPVILNLTAMNLDICPFPRGGALMLLRKTTVCMLICALLACPYPCLARTASRCCEEAENDCDCPDRDVCCPQDSSERGEDLPDHTSCCPESGTCLCHGAILCHEQASTDADAGLVAVLPPEALLTTSRSLAPESRCPAWRMACHFASAESGRTIRALVASYLL